MSGEVSPMLWYLFWVLAIVVMSVVPVAKVLTGHRHRMKALEILRSYAEKGVEPPLAIAELLMKQISEPSRDSVAESPREASLGYFIGFLFAACVLGSIGWWRIEAGGPRWAIYATVGFAVFFGVGALGLLIAALTTSEK